MSATSDIARERAHNARVAAIRDAQGTGIGVRVPMAEYGTLVRQYGSHYDTAELMNAVDWEQPTVYVPQDVLDDLLGCVERKAEEARLRGSD